MSPQRRGNNRSNRRGGGGGGGNKQQAERKPADFWRAMPEPELPDDITPATDPTAVLRSLGTPPLPGQGGASEHYVAAVIERASGLATALAAAAGLLADDDEDDIEIG